MTKPEIRLILDSGSPEQRVDEAMVSLCCEGLEIAIEAGVLKASLRGQLYINIVRDNRKRYWAIEWCPFCGHRRSEPVKKHQRVRGQKKKKG